MMRVIFLIEEPSAEALLKTLLPKLLPAGADFDLVVFQGKKDLLANLSARLKAYRKWIPDDWRLVVLLDADREDCRALKQELEQIACNAGFATKTAPDRAGRFNVLNRIAVEEIEAWFFGDVPALVTAYPGVSPNLGGKAAYRDPDAIRGGTWEALERVLKRAGHFSAGLSKIQLARTMSSHMDPSRNTSPSFQCFRSGLGALSPNP
jgi:hypothetical protein